MSLASGVTAAGFCIVRQLEHAEFGELYVAEHPRLPRLQLLQLIPAEIAADLDYREDFRQESASAATLWHPNILGLTDRGEFEDQLWISSDYLEGSDAAELLGENHHDGMPPKMVIEIVAAIAEALDYAHDLGVLHRYVNPGSIVVSRAPADKRRVALSGFGVARPIGDTTNTLTRADVFIGTASYTSPERLMNDALDGRSDQYSLAASAFHLLTGSPPFAHFNPAVTVSKHLDERPPRPSDVRPDLTEFDAIFARALSQDPLDRFRRCRDFARALELNGGTRSHVRATSAFLATSDRRDAGDNTMRAASATNGVAPTEPAPPAPPVTGVARAADPTMAPPAPRVHPVMPSPAADTYEDDDDDDESAAARSRRTKQTAAIAGTILVVVLAWFLGVRALRSASHSDDAPTSVEPSSTAPADAPAIITPSPIAPPPVPPAPVMAPPPPVVTTTPPVTTSVVTPTATTTPRTTRASTTPPTTTPSGLDTRPALGMPCGPELNGAAAVSNSGGPVDCVSTPGGFAWEPPGTPPAG